jgi:hypothetical protein
MRNYFAILDENNIPKAELFGFVFVWLWVLANNRKIAWLRSGWQPLVPSLLI